VAAAGELGAADGVDGAVDAVQAAGPCTLRHGALAQAEQLQLVKGDNPVLAVREGRDLHVDRKLNTLGDLWLPNVLSLVLHRNSSVPGRR